jgi:general secretion pathway protein K
MKPRSCNNWCFHRRGPAPLAKIRNREQTGVALITVLLIVFLASTAAVSLASVQQLTLRRSTLLLHREQARLYALGAEQWAAAILKRDQQNNQDNVDDLSEPWANLPPSLPIEGGKISGRIQDLQGRFNLNNILKSASQIPLPKDPGVEKDNKEEQKDKDEQENKDTIETVNKGRGKIQGDNLDEDEKAVIDEKQLRVDANQLRILRNLLAVLELPTEIADTIVDWIDPNQEPTFPDGAEDSEYTVRIPSYLAANRPLTSVSELRLIKGIDKTAYAKLAPHVCALPSGTPINVNTLTAPLLRALTGIDSMAAEAIIEELKQQGFKDINKFYQTVGMMPKEQTLQQNNQETLTVHSNHFMVQIEVQVGDGRTTLYSILERSKDGGTRVLMHSFGNEL